MTLFIVLLSELFSGCAFYQLRGSSSENPKPGAAAMCVYYREKRFIGEVSSDVYNINFVENIGNNRYANIRRVDSSDDKITDFLSVNQYCFIVTGLKAGTQYSIDRSRTTYVEGNVQYFINIELDPETAFKSIPIVVESGKIKFLGVYMFDAIVVEKGSLFKADKKSVQIVDGNEYLKDFFQGTKANYIYGKYEKSVRGAEANLLSSLLVTHTEGYWHDIAENRLKELGY